MAFGKPDLGSIVPKGASFDPALVNKLMGKFGHGGFLDMEYVGHGDDWVELSIDWREDLACVTACPPGERDVLLHQLDTGFGCTPTSSMGRLFDAVASLIGVRHTVDFEAQAAIEMEGLARSLAGTADPSRSYCFGHDDPSCFDAAPLIRAIVSDLHVGTDSAIIAARFHQAVAELVLDLTVRQRDITALHTVVLGGGVFQNSLLLRSARRLLLDSGFTVLVPTRLPPNDGGLALGQIMITATG